MDNSQEFGSIELCAGYNGIHLGLERVIKNLRTVAYVEIESFADANLVAKMEAGLLDAAPIWTDLKTFNAKPFRDRIHLITGGYPCQPFSAAGKRLGTDDPRHLWPYIYKIVETIRPVFCFFENVEGHLSLGFKEVQQSLRDLGYAVEAGIFSAAECGAPQQRKRLFILAYRSSDYRRDDIFRETTGKNKERGTIRERVRRLQIRNKRSPQQWPSRPGEPQHEWEPPRVVANSVSLRESQPERSEQNERGRAVNQSESVANSNSRMRPEQPRSDKRTISRSNESSGSAGRQTKSPVGRNSNGLTYRLDNAKLYESCDNRTDELRLLGNGVIPDVAEKAFVILLEKINLIKNFNLIP